MIYTPSIERAIHKASILHRKQARKGEDELPYITHLFSVFVILSKYTQNENILIAGLLHDTIEDTNYTRDELERDFGTRVKDIVLGVSEQKTKNGVKMNWVDRKKAYIQGLKDGLEGSLYVSAADKIHNFSSVLEEYKNKEEQFKKDFESEDRVRFYGAIVDVIVKRLGKEHPLAVHLQDVFDSYKTFLDKVYNN